MLTREGILGAKDLPVKAVPVPEWGEGEVVYVRTMTGIEVEGLRGISEDENYFGRFAATVLCDEQGERVFADGDAELLGKKNHNALRRICDEANTLNGMGADAQEEAVKN